MASIAAELFQVLTKHPYEPLLRLIPHDAKCNKTNLECVGKQEAKQYMVNMTHCITKGGKLKPNGLFDIFSSYSHKNASQTRRYVMDWASDNTLKLTKFALLVVKQCDSSFVNWLSDIRSETTPSDEICFVGH